MNLAPDPLAIDVTPGAVRLERHLPGTVERVWEYLVDPELRGAWLAPGPMEGRVGGQVALRFRHADLSEEVEEVPERYREMAEAGHVMHGVVTAWEPPRLLRYTWSEEDEGSEVTFELRPERDGVLLTITHRRLDGRAAMISVAGGWHAHVAILRDRLAGEAPPGFWGAHAAADAEYRRRLSDLPERVAPDGAATLTAAPDGRPLLRLLRDFEVPPLRLWEAITVPEQLDLWYPARLRLEGPVGGWVRETFPDDDAVLPEGTLLAFDPPQRFAFDLEADPGSQHEGIRHPQRIDMRIAAAPGPTPTGGSRLRFEHLFGDRAQAASIAAGWHGSLDQLAGALAGRGHTPDHTALRDAYQVWFAGVA